MKFTIPLAELPARCGSCLFACVHCAVVNGDEPRARRLTRLVEDIVRGQLGWFPGWRLNEIVEIEGN